MFDSNNLTDLTRRYALVLAPISGALITLSFAPYGFWPLSLVSLIVFALLAGSDVKRPLLVGWLYGFGLFLSGVSWVYVSIHEHGGASVPLAGLLTLLLTGGIGFIPALCFILCRRLCKTPATMLLIFPALWVISEWLFSWFLTGFPWLFVGYGHLSSPLAGWLPVIGSLGVSLLVAMSAACVVTAWRYSDKSRVIAVWLLVSIWVGGIVLARIDWVEDTQQERRFTLVQPNIVQAIKWDRRYFDRVINTTRELTSRSADADIVVWPEAAIPRAYPYSQPLLIELGRVARQQNYELITGVPVVEKADDGQSNIYNALLTLGDKRQAYYKTKLVPFGEFVPLEGVLRGLISFFDLPMSSFKSGGRGQQPLEVSGIKLAPVICYEVAYGHYTAVQAKNSDILLTVSNDSWFGKSLGPLQHFEMARIRAVENGRYVVRATNNGISAIIDHRGGVVARSEQFVAATVNGTAKVMAGTTPFNRYGEWPVVLMAWLLLIAGLLYRRVSSRT